MSCLVGLFISTSFTSRNRWPRWQLLTKKIKPPEVDNVTRSSEDPWFR
jgi:hypothetical protein